MKRRNAIILGTAFLLMVAGYVAWCWRVFYLPTPIHYQNGSSDEIVALVEKWRTENFLGPQRFDPELASRMLLVPWWNHRGRLEVHTTRSAAGDLECHISGGRSCSIYEDRYMKRNGVWTQILPIYSKGS